MVAKAAANFCLERRIIPGQKPPVCDPTKRFSKVQFNCNNLILDEKNRCCYIFMAYIRNKSVNLEKKKPITASQQDPWTQIYQVL